MKIQDLDDEENEGRQFGDDDDSEGEERDYGDEREEVIFWIFKAFFIK